MASFRKRGDLQWQARVRRQGFPDQAKTFAYREDAERWAREVERELDTNGFVDRRVTESTTFSQILERYAKDVTPLKRSHDSESALIRVLLRDPLLAQLRMSALTSQAVAEWRDRRLAEVSGSTVNRELNVISAVVNHSRREWGIHMENPVALVKRPPTNRARDRRLSPEEQRYLMAALEPSPRRPDGTFLKGGSRNPYITPIVLLALETAMRQGEILRLSWEHISLDEQVAHLPKTKNGDARDVPLSRRAVEILRGVIKGDEVPTEGRVFRTTADALKKGFPRALARARASYLESCKADGKRPKPGFLENIHFHDTRHEATTRLSEKLDSVLELSAVTGHRDLRMLKRYYHPRASDLAKKLD